MKKYIFVLSLAIVFGLNSLFASLRTDEGMWLPMFVERLNWTDIQKMGLQLTIDELYSINHSSLKDAVVGLAEGSAPNGFFCTGEIVSDKGLLFTNHHCAYDVIQRHSSIQHDYLTDGFWAMNAEDEIPNPGLTASFLVRMEDVTEQVLSELDDEMTIEKRAAKIREITSPIKEKASEDGKYDAVVKSFYDGSEYYLFVYQTFKDVRLVGAPPSSIGKFGGDTDNWMWPRHTGDFAILRVYSAPDGSPADYSKDNVPLKPKHHLPVSIKGYEKDDYAMIWGFPGNTERYLTSYGIDFAINQKNPAIIDVFGTMLDVMKKQMDADPAIRIELASDHAGIANVWKYFIGQTRGLKRLDVKSKKEEIEKDFINWYKKNDETNEKYGNVLQNLQAAYQQMEGTITPFYLIAIGSSNIECLNLSMQTVVMEEMLEKKKENKAQIELTIDALKETSEEFYSDYNISMDRDMLSSMLSLFKKRLSLNQLPDIFATINAKFNGDINSYVDYVFKNSIFTDKDRYNKFLSNPKVKTLKKDPINELSSSFNKIIASYQANLAEGQQNVSLNMRKFIAGLREMNPSVKYYPDANSSMRFTYGTIKDYYPADAVHYDYITHAKGILEKEDPTNEEFIVSLKLKELIKKGDFGIYGKDGDLVINFLSTNDITGGNSGSPVINGKGELIGIAFDGNWEAMSGDIAFENELQRTISVDIRYVLFVIDKYAGAKHLIDELTLVK
ncbi:MAG TPA: S46 family peptidase [Bacteroidales bacterium]|nr:MAG: Peptidase S46 [Bacteroidetes bacterium ADurb.Bin041]HNV50510.1 S46 family peptidase [Bacteroidales bacterium]HPW43668.1 S46 family peptidase [Bacteroidales bacterium]